MYEPKQKEWRVSKIPAYIRAPTQNDTPNANPPLPEKKQTRRYARIPEAESSISQSFSFF
jgi:hypothetical protein